MSGLSTTGGDRRLGDFFLAVVCLVALGLLAVAFTGGSGALTAGSPLDGSQQSAEETGPLDHPGLVGGGSLGGADRNPIGAGVGNETNPFQTRSGDIQFFVETDHPNYWRVDAYTEYTNGTWVRTGAYKGYNGQLAPEGAVTEEVTHQITLQRNATVHPAPWQPASATPSDDSPLAVSAETGLHALSQVSAGSEFSVSSYQYDPDIRQLRAARANYPASIQQRYTTLPDDVPERVVSLGDNITADAETPVMAACSVRDWISTNTEYDRDRTHQSGADPVDQFLFEMDGGTAEYSASSMVVLLRSQDIPARYVTGYSPGEELDNTNSTYAVRAINAHAWAEVYVTGHGWIPFDPTSSTDRIATENTAAGSTGEMTDVPLPARCSVDPAAEQSSDDPRDESTSETASGETSTVNDDDASMPTPESSATEPNVSIVATPEPLAVGGDASVDVLLDGEPMSNASVSLGEELVGTTDQDGVVEFRVPAFSDGEVPITVRRGEIEAQQTVSVGQFRLTADPQRVLALPGQETPVIATVGSIPVEGVEIRHGGTVETTDANGSAAVVLSGSSRTTVEAMYAGQQASTQIQNQLLTMILLGMGGIGLVSGVGIVLKRKYPVVETTQARASSVTGRLSSVLVNAIIWLENLPATMESERERGLWSAILTVAASPITVARGLWTRRPDSVLGAIRSLWRQLSRFVLLVVRSLGGSSQSASAESDSTSSSATSSRDEATATSVRQVWSTFVRLTVRRITPTHTPGEIAQKAIEKGFPRGPVLRLTDAFRAAVYGPTRSESLVDEATTALTEIETTTENPALEQSDQPPTEEGDR